MALNLGLDIGAISVKLAAFGEIVDGALLERLVGAYPGFQLLHWNLRPLVVSDYRRIAGSPIQSTYDLLQQVYDVIPEDQIEGIRVTGSGSRTISRILGIYHENEFKAIATTFSRLYPDVRTIFEIGGESSKYLRLDNDGGIADYDRSGECAAGTGSFLDQQALRMSHTVEQVGDLVCTASSAARIAGRCSVFAKSDMIHAQQKGYSPAEILRGLCDAVARNFKSAIVKGRRLEGRTALIGAVSQNSGIRRAMEEAFQIPMGELVVPEFYAWCGAIGSALLEAEEPRKRTFFEIHRLRQHTADAPPIDANPLSLDNVVVLRHAVKAYEPPPNGEAIPAYLGIDIGSVSTNVVAIDANAQVIHDVYLRTAGRPVEAVQQGLRELESLWGDRLVIEGVGTTGSGRELIAEFVGADTVNDEITAHKTGAWHISQTLGGEPVETIFEIGGQDSKFISIEDGVVVDFAMNEACAAGTGSFLEEQAEKLGIQIKGEFAELALSSKAPTRLGERCTVFMERDVTGWLHKGESKANLVAGLSYSIALNYLNRVVRGRKIGNVIYFQGGTAYNDAVTAAFSNVLGKKIVVPPYNGVMGAVGMALIARDWHRSTNATSRFRGYDLSRLDVQTRDFVCKACSNECDIKEFKIEGQKSFWGDKCSDKYRKVFNSGRKPVIEDLFAFREKLIADLTPTPADQSTRGPLVGIPRTMSTFDRYPFWYRYFSGIGVRTVLSRPTDARIASLGVELALAQPCFPVQVAHGHVKTLLNDGVDFVLVPNVLDAESHDEDDCIAHYCPWNQTLPYVLQSAPGIEADAAKLLAPSLHFQMGQDHVRKELWKLAKQFGVSRAVNDRAVDAAYAVQCEFQDRLLEAGSRAMETLEKTGEPGLILIGRGYNIYDRNINCDIPRKLRRNYGANVIPFDFLVTGREKTTDIKSNMYWASGRKILEATRRSTASENLHLIYISNFKCGPDSYIKYFARLAAGAPLLVLQFDGHGNDAGYMTRCEAYLDSKGILRCYNCSSENRNAKTMSATTL